jgi:hypothetical protein
MQRTILIVTFLLPLCPLAQAANQASIPTVACKSDGQMGPVAAPKQIVDGPPVPEPAAFHLAYYASAQLGVLAPRGWHCFGLYGSNGSQLIVTPEPHNARDLFNENSKLTGPAVHLAAMAGDTSGRFSVARTVARLFPTYQNYVKHVVAEGIEPAADFPTGPYRTDYLTRRSATIVEFTTPANTDGIGTQSRLAKTNAPINGVALLFPDNAMNLSQVFVRLPPDLADLSRAIVESVEQSNR